MLALEGICRDNLVQLPVRGDVNSAKFQRLHIKCLISPSIGSNSISRCVGYRLLLKSKYAGHALVFPVVPSGAMSPPFPHFTAYINHLHGE